MEKGYVKKPIFTLKLSADHFIDTVSCTGTQLSDILQCIESKTKGLKWYIFDMYGTTESSLYELFPNYTSPYSQEDVAKRTICEIEETEILIKAVQHIHQFERGVFIGIKKDVQVEWNMEVLPETEEDEGIQHELAEIEIRPFDFSYYEIHGVDISVLELLLNRFDANPDDITIV